MISCEVTRVLRISSCLPVVCCWQLVMLTVIIFIKPQISCVFNDCACSIMTRIAFIVLISVRLTSPEGSASAFFISLACPSLPSSSVVYFFMDIILNGIIRGVFFQADITLS